MMKNFILASIIAMLSSHVLAADTIRLNPDNDLAVYANTDATYLLISETATKTPTEASPAHIYVPIAGTAVVNQADYFLLKASNNTPDYVFNIADTSHVIQFPLYLNISATNKYLYAAVKDGTAFKVVKAYPGALSNVTNGNYTFNVSPQEMCLYMTASLTCNTLNTGTSADEREIYVYFFISPVTSIGVGGTIDITTADYSTGLFYDVHMSSRVYTSLSISLGSLRNGDRRAIIPYTSSELMLQAGHVRVFDNNAAQATSLPVGQLTGTLLPKEYDYLQNSEVVVTDLENGRIQPYNLSLLFVDKYQFASKASVSAVAEPQQIEELLKKNSCFLLTAGFGEDHYVIDYFRHFRDTVLSKSYLGRGFIHFYYELAPKYALILYQHEGVRAVIRGFAYTLYFIFNYYYLIIVGVAALGAVFIYRNRSKFRHSS